MDFGAWIKSVREGRGISLRAFARQTGVEFSTLQRIEAGKAEPSIRTAFQVCRGLGISLNNMIDDLTGHNSQTESASSAESALVIPDGLLLPDDIQAIIRADVDAERIAKLMLALVAERTNQHMQSGSIEEDPVPYVEEVPFFHSPIFEIKLRYPPQIGPDDILRFSRTGGAISLVEIGTVIRHRRKSDIHVDHIKPLYQVANLMISNLSASTISRIETGTVANIKLRDALAFDQAFGQEHDILQMYWNAPELEDRRTAMPMLPGLWIALNVDFFIILGRWLSLIWGDDHSWLEKIRAKNRYLT